ncbi:TPA: branched-chain-amino-acid transaminase [bacterium]|jgi:branched-chain amino acid aminotransferase|nr:branched-chain-amino-acid transaminase [bacterium]
MSLLIYLNGDFVPKEEAKVSVFDHGLLYGDGVFEGIRSYNGRVFRLDEHLQRLYDSAKVIRLKIPLSIDEMKEKILETLRLNKLSDAYIRAVVTRGVGDLGLDPDKCSKEGFVFIITDKIVLYDEQFYKNGLNVITVPTRRNVPEALNPRIKSLNYLNNILAKIEAKNGNVIEAIMLNSDGYVVECTGDNIFIIKNGSLYTPPTYIGALEGITRDAVMEIARKIGMNVEEKIFNRYEVYVSDECFLTGTAAEVIPVVMVDGRIIGDGQPGEITQKLTTEFRKLTQNTGTPIYPE